MEKSASIVAESEAAYSIDTYSLVKRLRQRKQKLSVIRRMEIRNE
jgi:hypothetical protein